MYPGLKAPETLHFLFGYYEYYTLGTRVIILTSILLLFIPCNETVLFFVFYSRLMRGKGFNTPHPDNGFRFTLYNHADTKSGGKAD